MCHRNANLLQSFCRGEVSWWRTFRNERKTYPYFAESVHSSSPRTRHQSAILRPVAMGKEPYVWFRLYGPEDAFWNKTFKMPDVELVQ